MRIESITDATDFAGGRLTIDLAALRANWRTLADRAPGAETAAVVKADGYGIGIEPAARALAKAGCKIFFVATIDEGLRARAVLPDATIYILNGLVPNAGPLLVAGDLRPVLGSMAEVEEWASVTTPGKPPVAIHVDSGMNRLGLTLAEARILAGRADLLSATAPALVMSHLACSDQPDHPKNAAQLQNFAEVRSLFPGMPASLANSGGVLLGTEFHFDLTRPGIALYGARASAAAAPLATVVTLEARIAQIRDADAGETVGYGASETMKHRGRIAILSTGYADGYHRRSGSSDERPGARAFLRGRSVPLTGRVSMDLMAIDVTDVPDATRGDWVELFGPHIPVDEAAGHADTIGYEFLTGLGARHQRIYLGNE